MNHRISRFFSKSASSLTRSVLAIASSLIASLLPSACKAAPVLIEKKPPVVERRTFESGNPNKEAPLKEGEDAITIWDFRFGVNVGYDEVYSRKEKDLIKAVISVNRIRINLELPITIWVPSNINEKLENHENGHRQIAEEIYRGADQTALRQAEAVIGKFYDGFGKTKEDAIKDAQSKAAHELNRDYCRDTATYSRLVSDIYDRATKHGKNRKPEFIAIQEAFLRSHFERLVGPKTSSEP